MSRSTKKLAAVALAVITCCASTPSLSSVAGTGGSTEITQLMNNMELIYNGIDGAETALNTVRQYKKQLEQFQQTTKQFEQLGKGNFLKNANDLVKSLTGVNLYESALLSVKGSLIQQKKAYDKRMADAKARNMTMSEYQQVLEKKISDGDGIAKATMEYEQDTMKQVNEDYAFAREQQSILTAELSQSASIGVLNNQMNRIVQQNARLIAIMAKSINTDTIEKQTKESEKNQQTINMQNGLIGTEAFIRQRRENSLKTGN